VKGKFARPGLDLQIGLSHFVMELMGRIQRILFVLGLFRQLLTANLFNGCLKDVENLLKCRFFCQRYVFTGPLCVHLNGSDSNWGYETIAEEEITKSWRRNGWRMNGWNRNGWMRKDWRKKGWVKDCLREGTAKRETAEMKNSWIRNGWEQEEAEGWMVERRDGWKQNGWRKNDLTLFQLDKDTFYHMW
jgi:hypothetical protein